MRYFGKNCIHFSGVWIDEYFLETDVQQDYEPEYKYCTHIENKRKTEGNCNDILCPLDRYHNYTFKLSKPSVI